MPTKSWSSKIAEAQKAPSFKELEEGTYTFVINDAGKVGQYNGVDQIAVNPSVEAGPASGRRVFHNFNFPEDNPTVLRIVFEQFTALGLEESYFMQQPEPTLEQVAQALKGRRFTADVVHSKSTRDPSKTFVNLRNFKPAVSPSTLSGPGGPGMAGPGPAGPGMPAPAAPAPAPVQPQYQQPAPPVQPQAQQGQEITAGGNPWTQQQGQGAAPQGTPWDGQQQQQQQQQQQPPAQYQQTAPQQAQAPQAPTQTWQAPPAPPLG